MKPIACMIFAAAAASITVAPTIAHAKTRAGDSATIYPTASVANPGLGRPSEGADFVGGMSIIIALLAAAAVIGGIAVSAGSGDSNQSPST